MQTPHSNTRLICAMVLNGLIAFSAFPQTPAGAHLAPEIREYVKFDSQVLMLSHVRVIDGTGAAPRLDQTIIIRDGKIAAIENTASTAPPPSATVIDLSGYTVIPGLVGMHDHMFSPQPVNLLGERARGMLQFEQQSSYTFSRRYLAAGVTSLRTTASVEPYVDLNLKIWIDAGKIPGPEIHVTGPYLDGAGNFRLPVHELDGPGDAQKIFEFWADQGVTSFKTFMHITGDELAAVIASAHKRGLKVTGHLCSITYSEAAEFGIDDIEHGFVKAGGTLLAGPDPTGIGGVVAGFGDQREVELLVEAGFTPVQVIHIATANGADYLEESSRIGTLSVGKQAHMVVIHGDPSSRISDIENVEIVFKDGIGYDSAKLIASVRGLVGSR